MCAYNRYGVGIVAFEEVRGLVEALCLIVMAATLFPITT